MANLINSDWGVRKVASPAATSPLTLVGFGERGEPVFDFTGPAQTYVDDPSEFSRWRAQCRHPLPVQLASGEWGIATGEGQRFALAQWVGIDIIVDVRTSNKCDLHGHATRFLPLHVSLVSRRL
ncbi:MAG: hypothetical protein ACR2GR_05450 [Rhodothermales bacterium]